jgi:hypothetical protein
MIVRILGEAQLRVGDGAVAELGELDDGLAEACATGEHDAFATALTALLTRVREIGSPVEDDYLGPSDLVLPSADASLAEVGALLTEEGLIPR